MISRGGHPWTDIDDHELRRLIAAGKTRDAIARQLGRTAVSIRSREIRLGVRRG